MEIYRQFKHSISHVDDIYAFIPSQCLELRHRTWSIMIAIKWVSISKKRFNPRIPSTLIFDMLEVPP